MVSKHRVSYFSSTRFFRSLVARMLVFYIRCWSLFSFSILLMKYLFFRKNRANWEAANSRRVWSGLSAATDVRAKGIGVNGMHGMFFTILFILCVYSHCFWSFFSILLNEFNAISQIKATYPSFWRRLTFAPCISNQIYPPKMNCNSFSANTLLQCAVL